MIEYKKVLIDDKNKVEDLVKNVIEKLENKEYFIPPFNNEFNEMFNENISIIYGAYDGEKLVAIAKLELVEKYDVFELKQILNLKNYKVAELGRYLCLLEYRNCGIMQNLQKILIEEAQNLNYQYLVATAHPDNVASNKVIAKGNFELKEVKTLSNGYYRNIYLKDIRK